MDNRYCAQNFISRHYRDFDNPEFIRRIIHEQKMTIMNNILPELADKQHYALRFQTLRENQYDGFLVRSTLDLTEVQYQRIIMPRMEIQEFSNGFAVMSEPKIDWVCVWCGRLNHYEKQYVSRGVVLTEKLLQCPYCNGSKMS